MFLEFKVTPRPPFDERCLKNQTILIFNWEIHVLNKEILICNQLEKLHSKLKKTQNYLTHSKMGVKNITLSIFYKQRPKWATGWMLFQFWQCSLTAAYFHLKSLYSAVLLIKNFDMVWCCLSCTGDCLKAWIQIVRTCFNVEQYPILIKSPQIPYSFWWQGDQWVTKSVFNLCSPCLVQFLFVWVSKSLSKITI